MKKLLLLFCLLFIYSQFSYAQTGFNIQDELKRNVKIPNTPEAAAFQKYGEVNISHYTGTPNISIPIYTFVGKEINLPISLTYDASGVKVSQLASSAGLNWNLNIGGRISRTVNGLPDDYLAQSSNPYMSINDTSDVSFNGHNLGKLDNLITTYLNPPTEFNSMNEAIDYFYFLRAISKNEIDTQPDFFSFNALGYSNTFVYDITAKEFKPLNNPKTKVTVNYDLITPSSIKSWVVTTDDGTQFFFTKAEETHTESADTGGISMVTQEYNSSWLLTQIISPTGKDVYTFHYTDLGMSSTEPQYIGASVSNTLGGMPSEVISSANENIIQTSYELSQQILTQIDYNSKPIIRINYKSRTDFSLNSAIDNIEILKFNSSYVLKKFKLNHSYFGNSSSSNPFAKRLKLDNVQETSPSNVVLKTHSFDYFSPSNVPSRSSLARDYLGYYNGVISNTVLYPSKDLGSFTLPGANRDPSFSNAIVGTLKKVTYPTGGYTEFNYEPHTSLYNPNPTTTEVAYGYLGITGGIGNGNNCGACCIDKFGNPPNINTTMFHINESGNYDLSYASTGITGEAYLMLVTTLIKPTFPTPYAYDEIIDQSTCNELVPIRWSNFIGNNGDILFLEKGTYQITLVKGVSPTSSQASLKISREESSTPQVNKIAAGFRIHSIKSYETTGLLSLEKQYKYTKEYSNNITSGKMLFTPIFYKTSQFQIINQQSGGVETKTNLTRTTSWSGGSTPHIAYSKVFEIQKNNGADNGYVEYNLNTGIQNGVTNNGYVNYYSKTFSNGKPGVVSSFNSDETKINEAQTSYEDFSFFGKSTIYIYNNPLNSYNFIRVYKANGIFKYEHLPAIFSASNSPTIGETIMNPNYPSVCDNVYTDGQLTNYCLPGFDFSTLETRQTYAQGKIGNVVTKRNINYFDNTFVQSSSSFFYDENIGYLLREIKKTNSVVADTLQTKFFYPKDVTSVSSLGYDNLVTSEKNAVDDLIVKNRLSTPIQTKSFKNGSLLSMQRTNYKNWGGGNISAQTIQTLKGTNSLEDRVVYHSYYSNGNVKELSQKDGTRIVYIWGYDTKSPVAKIVNATFTDIPTAIYNSIIAASNSDNDRTIDTRNATGVVTNFIGNEGALRQTLTNLRNHSNLSNAQITTFTYDPLIGVTSITDPRGETIYYHYDSFNRLEFVKDSNGKILSKNEYHYKN